jgi:hypothetical protein
MPGIDRIIGDYEQIYDAEGSYRSYCQDVANFCLPRKAWINSIRVQGERLKDNFLYDIRAIRNLKDMVCGFHSNLTNPSSRWFDTETMNNRYMEFGAIQRYYKRCDDIMFDVINDSNFDEAILETYIDLGAFGTGNLHTEDDDVDEVRYTEIPIEQYVFVEDARGRVFKVYRKFTYTALQCKDRWGEKVPKEVNDAIKDKPYQRFEILHYIGPRDKRNPWKADRSNMPWESLWIMIKPEMLLSEGGYQELPSAIGRWWKDSNGDPRGFSPAMDALASIKLLNAQKRTFIRHAMKASDPAWMAPFRSFLNTPNFNPSAANYYDSKHFKADSFKFLNPEGNFSLNVEAMDIEAYEIERAFYVDVFNSISALTQDKKKRSIPEIQRIIGEGMAKLGPIIGKVIKGTLTPTLSRTRAICERRLLFPPKPKELNDEREKVVYNSPLARAQRQSQMLGMTAYMGILTELSNFDRSVLDPVDLDKWSRIIADIQGVDPSIYKDEEEVKKIRAARAKMQIQQQQVATAEQAASATLHGAKAQKAQKDAENVPA